MPEAIIQYTRNADGSIAFSGTIPPEAPSPIPTPIQTLKQAAESLINARIAKSKDMQMYSSYTGPKNPTCWIAGSPVYDATSWNEDFAFIAPGTVLQVKHQADSSIRVTKPDGTKIVIPITQIYNSSLDLAVGFFDPLTFTPARFPHLLPSDAERYIELDTPVVVARTRLSQTPSKMAEIERLSGFDAASVRWNLWRSGPYTGFSSPIVLNESGSPAFLETPELFCLLGMTRSRGSDSSTSSAYNEVVTTQLRDGSAAAKWIGERLKANGREPLRVADLSIYKAK